MAINSDCETFKDRTEALGEAAKELVAAGLSKMAGDELYGVKTPGNNVPLQLSIAVPPPLWVSVHMESTLMAGVEKPAENSQSGPGYVQPKSLLLQASSIT